MPFELYKPEAQTEFSSADLKISITVKFPCDLRASLDMKLAECSNLTKWTAFVNGKGTLVHVVGSGFAQTGILVRLDFKRTPIAYASPIAMLGILKIKTSGWLNLNA